MNFYGFFYYHCTWSFCCERQASSPFILATSIGYILNIFSRRCSNIAIRRVSYLINKPDLCWHCFCIECRFVWLLCCVEARAIIYHDIRWGTPICQLSEHSHKCLQQCWIPINHRSTPHVTKSAHVLFVLHILISSANNWNSRAVKSLYIAESCWISVLVRWTKYTGTTVLADSMPITWQSQHFSGDHWS